MQICKLRKSNTTIQLTRLSKLKKPNNINHKWECKHTGILNHCSWEGKLVQLAYRAGVLKWKVERVKVLGLEGQQATFMILYRYSHNHLIMHKPVLVLRLHIKPVDQIWYGLKTCATLGQYSGSQSPLSSIYPREALIQGDTMYKCISGNIIKQPKYARQRELINKHGIFSHSSYIHDNIYQMSFMYTKIKRFQKNNNKWEI